MGTATQETEGVQGQSPIVEGRTFFSQERRTTQKFTLPLHISRNDALANKTLEPTTYLHGGSPSCFGGILGWKILPENHFNNGEGRELSETEVKQTERQHSYPSSVHVPPEAVKHNHSMDSGEDSEIYGASCGTG